MSTRSLKLQTASLQEMVGHKPYLRELAGFMYYVFPKVYKGSTDTELLCRRLDIKRGEDMWDIGTGTGLVALKGKSMGARYVLATDKNSAAVRNAKENSRILKIKIDVRKADVFGALQGEFDVITFNPPFTDHQARQDYHMNFWDKGNVSVKKFFKELPDHLTQSGRAFICWSSFGRTNKLKKIAKESGFTLKEVGRKKGKMGFWYYVYRATPASSIN